jgi:hypothetical protein
MSTASSTAIESDIPARLDRLPWSRFHWLLVISLGVTWVLDGLTVSEIFPVEMRGLAIALFFSLGTAVAAGSPTLFGYLVQSGDPFRLFLGVAGGALIMIVAAAVEWLLGIDTEQKALEDVATPLTAQHPEAVGALPEP